MIGRISLPQKLPYLLLFGLHEPAVVALAAAPSKALGMFVRSSISGR
jgi:hypothetical protein